MAQNIKPIVAIRPEPGCLASVEQGAEMGLKITASPMFEIAPLKWLAPDPAEIDGLLVGSANAFRHGGQGLAQLRDLPVHAVGEATAQAARDAGFEAERIGTGGLQGILDDLPSNSLRLLRLAGAQHVKLSVPENIHIEKRICYESRAIPMPPAMARNLAGGALVLLHSAVAATHFANECDRLEIDRAAISLAALGPRISKAAGKGWATCQSAPQPREGALLAIAREMWQ